MRKDYSVPRNFLWTENCKLLIWLTWITRQVKRSFLKRIDNSVFSNSFNPLVLNLILKKFIEVIFLNNVLQNSVWNFHYLFSFTFYLQFYCGEKFSEPQNQQSLKYLDIHLFFKKSPLFGLKIFHIFHILKIFHISYFFSSAII